MAMLPIVSALKHHKTTVVLVALEIALTCAIVTNALFLIRDRLAFMHMTTGVADNELVWVRTQTLDLGQEADKDSHAGVVAADLAALRGLPGVESVAMTNALPLGGSYSSTVVYRRPGDKSDSLSNVVEYLGSPGMLRTLGISLSEGRDFQPREYSDYQTFGQKSPPPTAVIVTRSFAQQMWPGEDPLGKPIYLGEQGEHATYVVGVAGHLLNPAINKYQGIDRGMILPVRQVRDNSAYVLRVRPDARASVARAIPGALQQVDPARKIEAHVYTDTIAQYFQGDRAMVWLLLVVIGCLLTLTALGVVGLSSFWVQQRTRTIGIRRAIGATRHDILRYFLAENFLIVSLGIVAGSAGAVGLNLWLMHHYELHRMPLSWLPIGALVLWLLGQLAVLGPALRAAAVPPVVATRSV
ncbi:ABC transporter permease [Fulvimonas sp. R45]|uniref:ABC transporter permease n=1 Tax=Fulvimonas sp. R45 TaxID=3045937 RepID=UPI00265DD12E|nr:FtsX-like permease family protein [Fulvimonas sp. R45]MDO1528250.1 ABC transporter permease [Fulvimonas sp. R45]